MTSNRDRAAEIIAPWIEKEWGNPEDNAESAADDLNDAGLIATEYIELAPHHRYGIGRTKDDIIISDNQARTTIRVPHDDVSNLLMGLLMAKKED